MTLALPKHVVVTDMRLRAVYYSLLLLLASFILYRFVSGRWWLKEIVPVGRVSPWAEGLHRNNEAYMLDVVNAKFGEPFCSEPALYEYWWDESWRFGPYSCLGLCKSGIENGGEAGRRPCIYPEEAYIRESADQIMFVTEFSETFLDWEPAYRFYFVPAVEALGLGFDYTFEVYASGVFHSRWFANDADQYHTSRTDILTVIVDSGNNVIKVCKPPETIMLTVPVLLQLAGRSLDDIQSDMRPNGHPNATGVYRQGPLARITGVEVTLVVSCYRNVPSAPTEVDVDWSGPACIVRVNSSSAEWAGRQALEVIDGRYSLRSRRYHGLRVHFRVDGSFGVNDPNSILLNLVSFIVLLTLPRKILMIFCSFFLGHLSVLYKASLYERFDVMKQCTGMVARLITMSATFHALADVDDEGISRSGLRRQLREVLRHRTEYLNEDEVDRFADCCFNSLISWREETGTKPSGLRQRLSHAKHQFLSGLRRHAGTVSAAEVITIDDFSVAYASIERFTFDDCTILFDKDRKLRVLEKVFLPAEVAQCLHTSSDVLVKECAFKGAGSKQHDQPIGQRMEFDEVDARLGGIHLEQATSASSSGRSTHLAARDTLESSRLQTVRMSDRATSKSHARFDELEASVQAQALTASAEVHRANVALTGLENEFKRSEDRRAMLERRVETLEVALDDSRTKVATLSSALAASQAEVAFQSERLDDLRDQVASLAGLLRTAPREVRHKASESGSSSSDPTLGPQLTLMCVGAPAGASGAMAAESMPQRSITCKQQQYEPRSETGLHASDTLVESGSGNTRAQLSDTFDGREGQSVLGDHMSHSSKFALVVKSVAGHRYALSCHSSDTVEALREQMWSLSGAELDDQHFFYKGKEVNPKLRLDHQLPFGTEGVELDWTVQRKRIAGAMLAPSCDTSTVDAAFTTTVVPRNRPALKVKAVGGQTYEVQWDEGETVGALKTRLTEITGIPADQLVVVVKGKQLDAGVVLGSVTALVEQATPTIFIMNRPVSTGVLS